MNRTERDREVSRSSAGELIALREQFVDRLWLGMALVILLAVPISLARATSTGWLPLYGWHLALGVVTVCVALVRHRLPLALKSGLFVAMLWLVGLPGLITLGLAAAGVLWLALSALIASTLYSPRASLLLGLAAVLAVALSGVAFVEGWLPLDVDLNKYARDTAAWGNLVLGTGAFIVVTLFAYGTYNRSTAHLLREIERKNEHIEYLALHDELTGLPKARLARDRLETAIESAKRDRLRVAVLGLDLDGFKQVNDKFGHAAGDAVLRELATRMRAELRGRDSVARMGGDEFMALLVSVDPDESIDPVLSRLVRSLCLPVRWQDKPLQVGVSIGVAFYPADGGDPETLMRRADEAMYVAKRQGGRRFVYWTPD
ncbi:diguanylate cyclase domain-containing protein [Arenimonas aestuarii]